MSSVETTTNINQRSFLLYGEHQTKTDAVLVGDAGRTTDLAPFTLMGLNPATNKYVPWDSTLANGSLTNIAIYYGEPVATADIASGDVEDLTMIIGGDRQEFTEDMLVFDNGTDTLDTPVGTGTAATSARQMLQRLGLYAQNTETVVK